ncbi:MAG: DUF1015 domain-containing protein [Candidatus Omnitrophica bacterium]|nr:DUF1015 domain-containing protein [Candidatus Omnitrophota bacterium]
MPEIRAFCGWRYNPEKITDLSKVLAPPYDVISKKEQAALHRRDPHNVVRLILGEEQKKDTVKDNRYTRARRFLTEWMTGRVLVQDEEPCLYVYAQDYREGRKKVMRLGFIAAMKLDERAVLKHENTLASPKRDRLALLHEVRTNLSPVFGLFEDPSSAVQRLLKKTLGLKPFVDIFLSGVRHRVFVESRPEVVRAVCGHMRSKPMFIADGHHRFEVACQFKNLMRSKFPDAPNAGWEYVMTYFSDCLHNPFVIYPTHRLIRIARSLKSPLEALRRHGELKKVKNLEAVLTTLGKPLAGRGKKNRTPFGIFTRKDGFHIFTLDRGDAVLHSGHPVDKLDVAVLHQRVLEPCFGIKAVGKSRAIDFTRDAQEACSRVKSGEFSLAVFLRATSLEEMIEVSKKGMKMPQKSTYFYPKLLSGLVFHRLEN